MSLIPNSQGWPLRGIREDDAPPPDILFQMDKFILAFYLIGNFFSHLSSIFPLSFDYMMTGRRWRQVRRERGGAWEWEDVWLCQHC